MSYDSYLLFHFLDGQRCNAKVFMQNNRINKRQTNAENTV